MKFFSRNVELLAPLRITSWRKIAIGTWRTAGDPSVYGTLQVDVRQALSYIEKMSLKTGQKVTITHFVGKAIAQVLEKHPELNCILRWGTLYPRQTVDLFFQVASDTSGQDLSGVTICEANRKSIIEIAREMQDKITSIREKGDPRFKKMKKSVQWIPGFMVAGVIQVLGFILYSMNIWSPLLGSPKDPFGSVMITNIGSIGLEMAFAPLVPYSRVPFLLAVGAVQEIPGVQDGKIEIQKVVQLCATFDHRLIDGMHASQMAKSLKKIFEDPEKELGPV